MGIGISTIATLLKEGGAGAYTPESIKKTQEIIEDLTKNIGKMAREMAVTGNKKRVTEEEIKLAAKYLIK